jgi:tetratricopeptide (TPR) repeat protein
MISFRTVILAHISFTLAAGAGETYQESLSLGDSSRQGNDSEQALLEYGTALDQASNSTEKSLALGKKGMVMAYDLKKYPEAAKLAEEALEIQDANPVAKVTALQVLAECQLKGKTDFAAAEKSLSQALALEGVDWSRPTLLLILGDARGLGKSDEAIQAYQEAADAKAVPDPIRAVAFLNIGLTRQYNLNEPDKARAAYEKAASINNSLQGEIDGHLQRMANGQ